MTTDGWITLTVLVFVLFFLVRSRHPTDVVLMAGLSLLLVCGVVTPSKAFSGFSNQGVLTVGVLFVVAAGVREPGGIQMLTRRLFQQPRSLRAAQMRIMAPVAGLSAFLNNTPLVIMMTPEIIEWARKFRMPASRLLIPLSYASLLGGLCTLIGTSTNLIVHGLLIQEGYEGLGLFDITWVGLPIALVGITFLFLFSSWMLPDRTPARKTYSDPREYVTEMEVEPGSELEGKSIEEAGLRHLPGLFLSEIERNGDLIPAVTPEEKLQGGDHLVFVGIVDSVADLRRFPGLKPATDQVFKLGDPTTRRALVEAVVSNTSPFVGRSIREGRFRSYYNAVVLAVARNGERVRGKIGDIRLQAGDTLLIEAPPSFAAQQRHSRDFYLISQVQNIQEPDRRRAWLSVALLLVLVIVVGLGFFSMIQGAVVIAGLLMATRCLSIDSARRSVDWSLLISIGAAFGIGQAMGESGAAAGIAHELIALAGGTPFMALLVIYAVTMVFTELITNNAAAVLIFPIAMATAQELGLNPMPFAIAVMVAASAGFATPLGYQTHLMVYGPGGYRFSDFLRIGVPLDLIVMAMALLLIPYFFPL